MKGNTILYFMHRKTMHKQQLMKGVTDKVGWSGFQKKSEFQIHIGRGCPILKNNFQPVSNIVLWISIQTIQKYMVKINSLDHIGHHSKSGNTILRPVGILKNKQCVCRSPKYKSNSAKIGAPSGFSWRLKIGHILVIFKTEDLKTQILTFEDLKTVLFCRILP